MSDLHDKFTEIQAIIQKAAHDSPLAARHTHLLAAAKQQPAERMHEAYTAGIRHFGENRVQEAAGKWPALKASHPDITLHLIGPLQTNKVKEAVALFDMIQTLDRPKLAQALSTEMQKQQKFPDLFIQVNIGSEPQKAGVALEEADGFIAQCRQEFKLRIYGLMCIPPADENPAPYFALLHEMAKRNGIAELSMGMSEDFETAVRMGATYVRLGRILFGERT